MASRPLPKVPEMPHPERRRALASLRGVAGFASLVAAGLLAVAVSGLVVALPGRALAEDAPALPSAAESPATPAAPPARPEAVAAAPVLFYFFSPDWRPPDLGRLTVAVEDALAVGGMRVSFQAFTRYEDFERQLSEKTPAFLLAPAWVQRASGGFARLGLTVVARPVRRGSSVYRKALMTGPGMDSIDDLARGSIAATLHSMGEGSTEPVLDAFHLDPRSARVVAVPKDVDALLALSFGQVDGALVTSEQYDQLALSNPAEAARLHVLAFTPEVPLPPVFACAGTGTGEADRLRDRLLHLGESPDGAAVLALLGFDGFVADAPPPPPPAAAKTAPAPKASPSPKKPARSPAVKRR